MTAFVGLCEQLQGAPTAGAKRYGRWGLADARRRAAAGPSAAGPLAAGARPSCAVCFEMMSSDKGRMSCGGGHHACHVNCVLEPYLEMGCVFTCLEDCSSGTELYEASMEQMTAKPRMDLANAAKHLPVTQLSTAALCLTRVALVVVEGLLVGSVNLHHPAHTKALGPLFTLPQLFGQPMRQAAGVAQPQHEQVLTPVVVAVNHWRDGALAAYR